MATRRGNCESTLEKYYEGNINGWKQNIEWKGDPAATRDVIVFPTVTTEQIQAAWPGEFPTATEMEPMHGLRQEMVTEGGTVKARFWISKAHAVDITNKKGVDGIGDGKYIFTTLCRMTANAYHYHVNQPVDDRAHPSWSQDVKVWHKGQLKTLINYFLDGKLVGRDEWKGECNAKLGIRGRC
jgi:hypothetical protein